jgi:antitoxin MazE
MRRIVKTKIVRIGNSRGVRIPKPLLEQAGLKDEVHLRVVDEGIIVEAARGARVGWGEAAAAIRELGESPLLDEPVPTEFDETEWEWE